MKGHRRWLALALAVALAVGAGLALRRFAFGTVRVAGASMEDTLHSGDVVLVTRFDYAARSPGRGDVVECRFADRSDTYLKRVIGLPGDEVSFVTGQLYVNGEAVEEPYVRSYTDNYAVALGEDEYLVLGDNRAESYDSRMADMGPVHGEDLLGRARWVLWPLGHFGPIRQDMT